MSNKLDLNSMADECVRILEPMLHRKPLEPINMRDLTHININNIESFFISFAEKDLLTSKDVNNQILLPACYQMADKLNKMKYYSFINVPISSDVKQWSVLSSENIRISIRKEYSIKNKQEEIILQTWVIED